MTERLYQHDSYLQTFSAQVVGVEEEGVYLDRTAFFPSGGGVVGDLGTLTSADGTVLSVTETTDREGRVWHRLDGSPPALGTAVQGELDWARRFLLMRYHTACHVLTGVMFTDYKVRVTGCQLTPEKGRVDFAFEQFDRALLEQGFERANGIIGDDRAVTISFLPAEEAQGRPELFKLETGFRHDLTDLRLVEIQDFDVQADGGCHVAHLGEVGQLVLTKSENKGKSNRRVYFSLEG